MAVKIEEKDSVVIYRRPSRYGPRDLWRAWQVLRHRYLLRILLMTRRVGAGYVFCRPQGDGTTRWCRFPYVWIMPCGIVVA
jgi:hypothetical protein